MVEIVNASGICVVLDVVGRIAHWSPSAAELYGWSDTETIGRSLRDLVGELPADGPAYHLRRDGIPIAVHVRRTPLPSGLELVSLRDDTALNTARAEVELRRGQVERLLGRMSDGVFSIDLDGQVQLVNPSGERLLGVQSEEVAGQPWQKVLGEALGPDASGLLREALQTGCSSDLVTILPNTGFLVEARAHPIPNGVSLYLALAGAATAEAVCRELFEASPEAQLLLDEDMVVECNMAAVRLLGLSSKSHLIGRYAPSFAPEVLHDGTLADDRRVEIRASLSRRGAFYGEWTFVRADGSEIPVQMALSHVRIGGRLLEHAIWHDLTDQKKVEMAAREIEDRFRAIVENSSDIVYLISATGKLLFVNPSFTRILGYPLEDVIGKPLTHFAHPDDLLRLREQRENALRQARSESFEFRIRTRDGDYRHLSTSGALVRSRDGVVYFVGTGHDVTDRVRVAQALEKARDAAIASSRAKSEFLATVSHEVRTPLNGVIGAAELLLDADLPADERELVRTIQSSGETLLRIIDDILEVSKAQAGHLTLMEAPTDIRRLLSEIGDLLRPRAEAKGIELACHWECDGSPWGYVDPTRLKQVIGNLIGNAAKFTRQGGVSVNASLWDGRLRVSVVDTGIGIPPDSLSDVFQPFKQADGGVQREFGGTGLGLAICKELVQAMQGTIGVESEVGVGSRFWFEIPVRRAEPVVAVEGKASRMAAGTRILVVEDNEVNRIVVTRMLAQFGCDVDVAVSGEAAIQLAGENVYDLILMDVQMPGIDGLEATRRIRQSGRPARIVALTANAFQEDREACLDAGMDAFLSKPIRRADLARVLEGR